MEAGPREESGVTSDLWEDSMLYRSLLGADGFLMPAKKDQAPPDLRYFKQSPK
jgi:hypothetical protein